MSNELFFTVDNHVAYVTLNRPQKMNAINASLDAQLADCWNEIDANRDIWVAVLAATGKRAFCAGGDLGAATDAADRRVGLGGGLTGVGGPLRQLRKPLVALVHGYVLGGGFELAMCADIIVATDDAQFGLPEVRAGIIGEAGVVHRAIRQLPHRVAMAMILTGERLPAERALHFGLVNEVVPASRLAEAGGEWVDRLTAASPLAQQAAKQAVLSRAGHPLDVALSTKYEAIEAYAGSEDVIEGRHAFAERRPPVWRGR